VPERVRGSLPQVSRRPVSGAGGVSRARHHSPDHPHPDPELRRRIEPATQRTTPVRVRHDFRPAPHVTGLRHILEQNLLLVSAVLLSVGTLGWCLFLYDEFRSSVLHAAPPEAASIVREADVGVDKSDLIGGVSSYARTDARSAATPASGTFAGADQTSKLGIPPGTPPAGTIVARDFDLFQPTREADRAPRPVKTAKSKPPVRVATAERAAPPTAPAAAPLNPAPQAPPAAPAQQMASPNPAPQVASLGPAPDTMLARPSPAVEAKTSLADFESAPFPYHGMAPGSGRNFLNAGEQSHLGHTNFRGRVFWESQTYSDDHVLMHIPAGFDPRRPAVMVVFFHGHGAVLARDVRDRQRVPAQISAAGVNAVLVAPQFAVDAADSSAGKFWEPDGFKRFLDEAAQKLATLYGNPRSTAAFANMPVVIVAYSGGFGPLLSVLARGGVRQRIRGLVMLDALYGGFDQFADWIANNRSTFFVSSYTPYTARHNAELEHLLDERGVPYGSELRRNHLPGMVTFLPAGPVSHRDFVTHAWADNPIEDILVRMDDISPDVATAGIAAPKRN
jgi:hypothetical protein